MTHLFGADYESLFVNLLESHRDATQRRRRAPEKWCAFWPMIGRKFQPGGVMVVGRALNGWDDSAFTIAQLGQPEGNKDLVRRCRESFSPADRCPMAWVEHRWGTGDSYRTSQSQFWQTARRLAEYRGYQGPDWPSTLVWTNLMRVSPAGGGNPPNWSCVAQLEPAAKLLDHELKVLRPALAIFLTGHEWFRPFQEETGLFALKEANEPHVHYAGQHGHTQLIVSDHPQTRSPDRIMEQVAKHWPWT